MKMMNDPLDITAIRQMVMGEYWRMVHEGIDGKQARKKAVELVAAAADVSPVELEKMWSDDMRKRKTVREKERVDHFLNLSATNSDTKVTAARGFIDDNSPSFYDDLQQDSPTEEIYWLKNQLKGTEPGKAKACLFDTEDEANAVKKNVARSIRLLGWRHSRKNPGFYVEIFQLINEKWKLRVKRLR